ncbi:helix-turn-helix domain-containing protein, partial [Pseudomonas aeruginosa]
MVFRVSDRRLHLDSELRVRILQLGLRRVAEGGFAELTMQALADDAGIATGCLYRHFRGKGVLAAEIFRRASH